MTDPVLFAERGSSWWPVLWGPAFALAGLLFELLTPGPVHAWTWLLVGGALAAGAAVWVHGRRRLVSVRLTPDLLVQGREELAVSRISAVAEVGPQVGARVLGGSWTTPKGTAEVPLRLADGEVVLAWARDPAGLSAAVAARIGEA
ncbi:hypothetical protein IQ251_10570 [Saccharopolyspora sp. HNM0983]|uniref:DUF3093 domain-containing protein n=1 Tax=Saccharopolyspora montiporae TaxID=2781240 RepID=A0A929FXP3_9PSEU|nr:hypothetical protein [Saccharopolyspora sp. HNM0983]MBE9374886.1 hypothetical protein [Saccharopolyspora sp. HNM0983]